MTARVACAIRYLRAPRPQVPFAVFGALLATVNTAQLTKAAPLDTGTIVAIDMSVGSGVRVLSPTVRGNGRESSLSRFRLPPPASHAQLVRLAGVLHVLIGTASAAPVALRFRRWLVAAPRLAPGRLRVMV